MRRRILPVLVTVLGCVIWTTTLASGAGPSPGLSQGWDGLASGKVRYVSVPAGGSTSIQVISRAGGRVLRHMTLRGTWGIPLVAYAGTAEGLFPDGRTLLLAQPLYSGQTLRASTRFALVDTRKMKVRGNIRLKGAFTFDALSPNASEDAETDAEKSLAELNDIFSASASALSASRRLHWLHERIERPWSLRSGF